MRVEILTPGHPLWDSTTQTIALVYRKAYGARLTSFMPRLLSVFGDNGLPRAVVGMRHAADGPLFLETYLDEPIEQAIAAKTGKTFDRRVIVEIGNMAESRPGDARLGIIGATMYLHKLGYRWVVFTAVPQLLNAFKRLGIGIVEVAPADPARLPPDQVGVWGTYYDEHPMVCLGDISGGYDSLRDFDRVWLSARDLAEDELERLERMAI